MVVDILQVHRHRSLSRLDVVDIASSMRRQIDLTVLIVRELRFARVKTYCILDEEEGFFRQQGRSLRGSQVDLTQEHAAEVLACRRGAGMSGETDEEENA